VVSESFEVSVTASTIDFRINKAFNGPAHVVVEEIRDGIPMRLMWEVHPLRMPHLVVLPLYSRKY
jgi:hypothetical protein